MGMRALGIALVVGSGLFPGLAHAGMRQVLQESGPYVLSVDGAGSAFTSALTWRINRPSAGATVRTVYATVSSAAFTGDPGGNCLVIDGIAVKMPDVVVDSGSGVYTRYGDVTAALAPYLEALPSGNATIPFVECGATGANDGSGLLIVWEDRAFPDAAVALAFGSELTGLDPTLTLVTDPLDTSEPDFKVEVGLGISYSTGSIYGQSSDMVVNGTLVDQDAGGFDDGDLANGGLYTLGGDGDGPDSERYDVTSLVSNGDTQIEAILQGDTFDDYAVVMWLWGVGITVPCPDANGDGIIDSCKVIVDLLSPKVGPTAGGNAVDVLGEGFDPSCVTWLGGVEAPTTFVDETHLIATPPAHAAGIVDVEVVCASANADLAGGYSWFDEAPITPAPPDVVAALPYTVLVAGGDSVTIQGLGFDAGAIVRVDGVDAAATWVDSTQITVVAPPHAAGNATVEVVNGDGTSDALFAALLYVEPDASGGIPGAEDTGTPAVEAPEPGKGGCSTSPGGSRLALLAPLLLLALRRRRGVALGALAAAAGCSEYELQGAAPAPETVPEGQELPPVALTGPPASTVRGVAASLDGTSSHDPDGSTTALSWAWEIAASPAGAQPVLLGADTATPTLASDTIGVYVVSLRVTDAQGLESTNPAAQAVEVQPWRDLEVTLAWDAAADLDLHLIQPGGGYFGAGDCFSGNPRPDWGIVGSSVDDPELDADDDAALAGPHQEAITLAVPPEGPLSVVVVYWRDRGAGGAVDATLTLRGEGTVIAEFPVTLDVVGAASLAGAVDWTTLGWIADGTATTHDALGGPPFDE